MSKTTITRHRTAHPLVIVLFEDPPNAKQIRNPSGVRVRQTDGTISDKAKPSKVRLDDGTCMITEERRNKRVQHRGRTHKKREARKRERPKRERYVRKRERRL
jgi:hypothetical protein